MPRSISPKQLAMAERLLAAGHPIPLTLAASLMAAGVDMTQLEGKPNGRKT